jgi:hypothetical protein
MWAQQDSKLWPQPCEGRSRPPTLRHSPGLLCSSPLTKAAPYHFRARSIRAHQHSDSMACRRAQSQGTQTAPRGARSLGSHVVMDPAARAQPRPEIGIFEDGSM